MRCRARRAPAATPGTRSMPMPVQLSGMPARRALGAGWLSRPLLDWRRSELEAWARQQGLDWIEDPANADERFARTALRHRILPGLRHEWPQLDRSLLRLAEHASEAGALLDELAQDDLQLVAEPSADPWLAGWPSWLNPMKGFQSPRLVG